jgi:excisionase family DNA binding protein
MTSTPPTRVRRKYLKAELNIPQELVELIAVRVVEMLKPMIASNGKTQDQDIVFDVAGLAEYLRVSSKWIYERTQFKEIPHTKVKGLLRFRKKDIDKWLSSFNKPAVDTPVRILKAIKR